MVQLSFVLRIVATSALALATLSLAAPLDLGDLSLPSGPVNCGGNIYTLSQIMSATSAGKDHLGHPIGSNSYPHRFNNYEGIPMHCSETLFNEWPILQSGTYNGGSPGADRVVFADNGDYCATVTHTGASGNNFVACGGD